MSTLIRGSDPPGAVLVVGERIAAVGLDAVDRGAQQVIAVGTPAFRAPTRGNGPP